MDKIRYIFLITLMGTLGCTQKATEPTAADRAREADKRVTFTSKQIEEVSEEVVELQKEISEIRTEAAKSGSMRGRLAFNQALTKLDQALSETRATMNALKAANLSSYQKYKDSLDQARAHMQKSFEHEIAPLGDLDGSEPNINTAPAEAQAR